MWPKAAIAFFLHVLENEVVQDVYSRLTATL